MDTQSNNNFDPASIGATPVTTGNGASFDPASIGATQVQNTTSQTVPVPANNDSLPMKILKGAGGVLNEIEKPFLGVGAIPVQILAKLTGQPDPYANGIPSLTGENIPVTDLNLEKKIGDAAQVASYFVPGEGILGAAGMGTLQGAGSEMSKGAGTGDVIGGGVLGAGIGAGTAGAFKLGGLGIGKLGDLMSGQAADDATVGIKNAYASALNLNASERAFENRSGKDLAQVLVDNKAPLGRYENGTLDASAAIEKLQQPLDTLNAQAKQVLSKPEGVVKDISLSDVFNQVKERIQKLPISQIEKNSAVQHAQSLFAAEAKQYGESVSPEVADTIKQGMWGSSFKGNLTTVDKLQGNVSYLAGNTLKTNIEKAVAGTDAGDVLPAINKQRGDLIDAIKRLTNLDGVRLLRGGRLGNISGGLIGAITGLASGLGPLAALGGDYFGSKAAEFLNSPETKIGAAVAKKSVASFLPRLLGSAAKPVGEGINTAGTTVARTARPAGLLANILTQK